MTPLGNNVSRKKCWPAQDSSLGPRKSDPSHTLMMPYVFLSIHLRSILAGQPLNLEHYSFDNEGLDLGTLMAHARLVGGMIRG